MSDQEWSDAVNPFAWLRRRCAEAVVEGVSDGLRAVAPDGEPGPADLGELRALLAGSLAPRQLPAAPEPAEEPARRRR